MTSRRVHTRWIEGDAAAPPFAFLASPGGDPPAGGVLLLHEAFGLNADMQALAGRLAERVVLVPDLYWRDPDRLAGYDERTKAIAMLKTLPDEQVFGDAARGLDVLARETRGAPLAVAGLRIGGRYALLVAAREARLRRGGAPHEIVRYPGVKPGFVVPGRDTYRDAEAADAWDRMGRFLASALASAPPRAT